MKLTFENADMTLSYDSEVNECPIRLQGNLYVEHDDGGLQLDFVQLVALKRMIDYLNVAMAALEEGTREWDLDYQAGELGEQHASNGD